jgi:hypothetical protein
MATKKTIEIESDADPKKRVVKFDLTDEKQGTSGALYIDNAKAGKHETIRVTVELL